MAGAPTVWTLPEWRAALEGRKCTVRPEGNGLRFSPCPSCGDGTWDTGWIRPVREWLVGGCNEGCGFRDLVQAVFPREAGDFPPPRRHRPRTRVLRRPGGRTALEGDSGRFAGGGPLDSPKSGGPAETDPVGSALTRFLDPPKGRGTPGNGPKTSLARRFWRQGRPIPSDPDHPARRWAARQHLWRPSDPFPPALLWSPWKRGGGSVVACFAPVRNWAASRGRVPFPTGVQLIRIDHRGRPQKDRGGKGKRDYGRMNGAVLVLGDLGEAGGVHVCEGVADALAVAAREQGAVIAARTTGGFKSLPAALVGLGLPVMVWPGGDQDGRLAATRLVGAVRDQGLWAVVARIPEGASPATFGS